MTHKTKTCWELAIEDQDIAIATLSDDNLNISISMRAFDKGYLNWADPQGQGSSGGDSEDWAEACE